MSHEEFKTATKKVVILILALIVFSFIGDYTGAASRFIGDDVYGFRYDTAQTTTIKLIGSGVNKDGVVTVKRGEKLIVGIDPGVEGVFGSIKITKYNGDKVYGGVDRREGQGKICVYAYKKDPLQKCIVAGSKCNCRLSVPVSTLTLREGKNYFAKVCDGSSTINQCNDEKGVISAPFVVVPKDKIIQQRFFRGQTD